jgi:hypothetical protein
MKAIVLTAKQKVDNQARRRRVGPTCGFVASPVVGSGTTVGTLQTGYLYIQASSQDKLQGVHPHTVTCPMALNLTSRLRSAPVLPRVLWLWSSPLG